MPKCDFNKLLCNFIEIICRRVCSLVNLLHTFRTPFYMNTPGGLLLEFINISFFVMVIVMEIEDI